MRRKISLLLLLCTGAAGLSAQNWLVRETPYFNFVYRVGSETVLTEMVDSADETYLEVSGLIGIEAPEKAVVLIADAMDDPPFGGYTSSLPRRIVIPVIPGLSYKDVLRHEYTHWLQSWVKAPGLLSLAATLFGDDLLFSQLGLGPTMIEGTTSLVDGIRASERNQAFIRAAMYDERMWTYEQGTVGSSSFPFGLRVYLSNWLTVDYLYRHYGLDALRRIFQKQSADFPVFDRVSIRDVTGDDPHVLWGRALRDFRTRWGNTAAIPRGTALTPQDALDTESWSLPRKTDRGWLVYRSSTAQRSALGFIDLDGRIDNALSGTALSASSAGAGTFGWGKTIDFDAIEPAATRPNSFSSDKSGNTIVFSSSTYLPATRPDSVQLEELWILKLDPASRNAKLVGTPRKLGRFALPALSPDGSRLVASQRSAGHFRLVEVDQTNGQPTVLFEDPAVDVLGSEFSPDGKKLVLLVARKGHVDLAVFSPGDRALTFITDDRAEELAPQWKNDDEIVFSSDRENALWSYVYDTQSGRFSRLFAEPVGSFGVAFADDGSIVYRSPQSSGQGLFYISAQDLKPQAIPEFPGLVPRYIEAHDALLTELREASPAVGRSASSEPSGAVGIPATPDKAFTDIPGPRYWVPSVATYGDSFGFGFATYAYDYMGHSKWSFQADFVPSYLQVDGTFALNFAWDRFGLRLSYDQSFAGQGTQWRQRSLSALNASLRFAEAETPWGDFWYGDAGLGLGFDAFSFDSEPFSIDEGFTLPQNGRRLWVSGALSGGYSAETPSLSYAGGPGVWLNAQTWIAPFADGTGIAQTELPTVLRGRSGFQIGLGHSGHAGVIGFQAGSSWSNEATAWQYLSPANPAWINASASARLEGKLWLSFNGFPDDPSYYAVAPIWNTLTVSIAAGANARDPGLTDLYIDPALYYEATLRVGLRAYTNDFPFAITVALRQPLERAVSVAEDLYVSFGLPGIDF